MFIPFHRVLIFYLIYSFRNTNEFFISNSSSSLYSNNYPKTIFTPLILDLSLPFNTSFTSIYIRVGIERLSWNILANTRLGYFSLTSILIASATLPAFITLLSHSTVSVSFLTLHTPQAFKLLHLFHSVSLDFYITHCSIHTTTYYNFTLCLIYSTNFVQSLFSDSQDFWN